MIFVWLVRQSDAATRCQAQTWLGTFAPNRGRRAHRTMRSHLSRVDHTLYEPYLELTVTAERTDPTSITRPRQAVELTEGECWRLLSSVSFGRVVFTHRAMPAIRPVNHLIDGRTIIIRTHNGAAITARAMTEAGRQSAPHGSVVCYEADDLDPVRHTGWSVIATGLARLVTDPADIARYSAATEPWIAGEMDQVVAIEPGYLSGLRLVGWCA